MKSTKKFGESRFLGTLSPSSIRNLLPGSISAKHKLNANPKTLDLNDENAPPLDPNISCDNEAEKSRKSLSKSLIYEAKFNGKNATTGNANAQFNENGEKSFATASNPETNDCLGSGECGRSIRNELVGDEITEENGNELGDQIHQLKEELIRSKSATYNSNESGNRYFTGKNARESLNELRVSLNRSLAMPCVYDMAEEDKADISLDDVKELHQDFNKWHSYQDKKLNDLRDSTQSSFASASCEAELMSDDEIRSEEGNAEVMGSRNSGKALTNLSVIPLCQSPVLEEPTLTESPKIRNTRKNTLISSNFLSGENSISKISNPEQIQQNEHIESPQRTSKPYPDRTGSLAASLQRGMLIIDRHQRNQALDRSSVSFSFEHLTAKSCADAEVNTSSLTPQESKSLADAPPSSISLCPSCQEKFQNSSSAKDMADGLEGVGNKEKELKDLCMNQATKIHQLNGLLKRHKNGEEKEIKPSESSCGGNWQAYIENNEEDFDSIERAKLLSEIADLKRKLQSNASASRASLLSRSIQLRKSMDSRNNKNEEELEQERQKWTEAESEWILLTDELRVDIEAQRRRAEDVEMELKSEKQNVEELDDALHRAVLGHARLIEQYTELQEKYQLLDREHRTVMEGVAEVKRAVAKAKGKGRGARFAKAVDAELSTTRAEKEREREFLKKENKNLKSQLRDTAEAVQAAGELLVRLREAEQAASNAEENLSVVEAENEKLKKQIEKVKSKHKMEMASMKQCLAESKLPSSALQPFYMEDSEVRYDTSNLSYDDQAWRAEFGAIYQEHL